MEPAKNQFKFCPPLKTTVTHIKVIAFFPFTVIFTVLSMLNA